MCIYIYIYIHIYIFRERDITYTHIYAYTHPQAAILAVGTTTERLVSAPKGSEQPYDSASFMTVSLSCDHRVIDGAVAARWLQAFKGYLEDPLKMLL